MGREFSSLMEWYEWTTKLRSRFPELFEDREFLADVERQWRESRAAERHQYSVTLQWDEAAHDWREMH